MNWSLLILAAGMGSRYGGLKQLDSFGPKGETLLDFSIQDALKHGCNQLVFVIRKELQEEFESKIASHYRSQAEVSYAYQELDSYCPQDLAEQRQKPWGTGHAVLVAQDQISQPFVVINADDYYGEDGYRKLHSFFQKNRSSKEWAIVCFPLEKTLSAHGSVSRGVCQLNEDRLVDIQEHTGIERKGTEILAQDPPATLLANTPVSMNLWGLKPEVFTPLAQAFEQFLSKPDLGAKEEFYLPAFLDQQLKSKEATIHAYLSQDQWMGVTFPQDKSWVQEQLALKMTTTKP